ncbi:hypothetical protein [Leisingera thetidis]|uniref:hypothetical protein n=1 Tax=Leisingera thetidis TaxID=2930199 RepID=UPI0021F70EDF|nr:hypothetical protein [Leisingera thetidis]
MAMIALYGSRSRAANGSAMPIRKNSTAIKEMTTQVSIVCGYRFLEGEGMQYRQLPAGFSPVEAIRRPAGSLRLF